MNREQEFGTSGDVILDRRVFLALDRLKDAGDDSEDDCILVAPGQELSVDLIPGELSGMDRIDVVLASEACGDFVMVLELHYDSSRPGVTDDERWSAPNQQPRSIHDDRLVLPFEAFCLFGYPGDWAEAKRLTVAVKNGPIAIRRIEALKREIPEGPRMTNEQFFYQALDLKRPELSCVRVAADRGEWDEAGEAFIAHLRQRTNPVHGYQTEIVTTTDHDCGTADEICAHRFRGQQLPDAAGIWSANPVGNLEFRHALHRHYALPILAEAYLATGEMRYADVIGELMNTWLAGYPRPVDSDGGGGASWTSLCVGRRAGTTWPPVFFAMLNSPSFRTETLVGMLKSWHAHAEYLMTFRGHNNNWQVVEAHALFLAGLLFPEFKRAAVWRQEGLSRALALLDEQVWPDGVQQEVTPGYHSACLGCFLAVWKLCRDNGITEVEAMRPQLGRHSFDHHIASSRTDVDFAIGNAIDYASGVYDEGYGPLNGGLEGVVHRREIVFVKPDYWLVLDSFLGEGMHEPELLFHFAPMRLFVDGNRVTTGVSRGAGISLHALWPEDPQIRIRCGETTPVQGWVAMGQDVPAPVACLSTQGKFPLHLVTAIMPFAQPGSAQPRAMRREYDGLIQIDVCHEDGATDHVLWRISSKSSITDARIAAVRSSVDGRVTSAAQVRGSFLAWQERKVEDVEVLPGNPDYAGSI